MYICTPYVHTMAGQAIENKFIFNSGGDSLSAAHSITTRISRKLPIGKCMEQWTCYHETYAISVIVVLDVLVIIVYLSATIGSCRL